MLSHRSSLLCHTLFCATDRSPCLLHHIKSPKAGTFAHSLAARLRLMQTVFSQNLIMSFMPTGPPSPHSRRSLMVSRFPSVARLLQVPLPIANFVNSHANYAGAGLKNRRNEYIHRLRARLKHQNSRCFQDRSAAISSPSQSSHPSSFYP